ncbi:cytochrome P450 [Kitasatospora sp. LaBMicrA B282]|uniref:cytochrome P450 n=1 Tax=Kitasatospora sp. LaBMicrA B282 TaxID=3420949 RepID=UPI003D11A0E5
MSGGAAASGGAAERAWARARRRDRRVYLVGHPVLFALLCATRHRPVVRLGRTVLVHGTAAYREVLTRVPLDRTAAGTTGGAAARLTGNPGGGTASGSAPDGHTASGSTASSGAPGGSAPDNGNPTPRAPLAPGLLFDQDGSDHRTTRRALAGELNAAVVRRARASWQALLAERLAGLTDGGTLDLVELSLELAGRTTAALTGSTADPLRLARAATAAAAAAAREHLPGPHRRRGRAGSTAADATAALTALLADPAEAMLAVAAVNTTVAALPRAAAWCADAGCWPTPDAAPGLATELLRSTAPSPLLPRVAAADATVAGCPIRAGDRLLLVARHAAQAHRPGPAAPVAAQAVFGTGPHACPGAGLARAQLADFLAALAVHRPVVVRRRVDRRAALPGYRLLIVRGAGASCG